LFLKMVRLRSKLAIDASTRRDYIKPCFHLIQVIQVKTETGLRKGERKGREG